jgi:2-polyprenyl-3-methyl-5-hydroxy-6-metoxy-1,4-benzoquinol methylase
MTDDDLRNALLAGYLQGQAATASAAMYSDIGSQWPYYTVNYGPVVARLPTDASILELGPGHGSLLAWLRSTGFSNLSGVDASPGDVEFANTHLGEKVVAHGYAVRHLAARPATFDFIAAKAVLEHIPRTQLLSLVDALHSALKPGGLLLVDVPNMDWILAGHERYMDLTHESGFTRESLHSLLSLRFAHVEITGSRLGTTTRSQRLFRGALVAAIRRALYVLGEGASDLLFESRSIVAVARRGD